MQSDIFRPRHAPARVIYDVLQSEASKREHRSLAHWQAAEMQAVWSAARDYAQQHGVPVPSIDQVKTAEACAVGHVDYAAKWAYGVARLLISASQPEHGEREA